MTEKRRGNDGKTADRPWGAAWIVLAAAGYFSVAADLPHVLIVTAVLLAVGLFGEARRVNDRTVIYSAVAALALTAVGNYLWPMRNDRFGFLAYFTRPQLLAPFALFSAALIAGFRRRSAAHGAAAAAALLTFAVGGDLPAGVLTAERFPGVDFLNLPRPAFYIGVMAATAALTLLLLRGGRRSVIFALIGVTGVLIYGELLLYRRYERSVREFETRLLRFGIHQIRNTGGGTAFDGSARNLRMPFAAPGTEAENRVLFRVAGRSATGYLRGRALRFYQDGGWRNPDDPAQSLEVLAAENPLYADQCFLLPGGERAGETLRVYPVGNFSGRTVLLPEGCGAVEMIAESAALDSGGGFSAESPVASGGFLFWRKPDAPFPGDAEPAHFLELPTSLRPRFVALARRLKLPEAENDRARIGALRRFFDTEFQYSLDWPGCGGDDPALFFLEEHRRGHCELFASGAALLLRAAGVPARLVTGAVCVEPGPGNRYSIVRLRNLHAWTEYFDRELGRWVRFDPTPDGGNTPVASAADGGGLGDSFRFRFQELIGALRRGHATAALAAAGFALLPWCWVPVLVWLAWRRFRSRRNGFPLDAEQRRGRRAFLRLVRAARRRDPSVPEDPSVEELLPFLTDDGERCEARRYQRLRFRPDAPSRK